MTGGWPLELRAGGLNDTSSFLTGIRRRFLVGIVVSDMEFFDDDHNKH